nr:hypothetical protein [Kyrpidia spormannii]
MDDPRVVDEDINRVKFGHTGRYQLVHFFFPGDIRHHSHSRAAQIPDLGNHSLHGRFLDVIHHHPGCPGRQCHGDRPPDTPAGARNDRRLPIEHMWPSSLSTITFNSPAQLFSLENKQ